MMYIQMFVCINSYIKDIIAIQKKNARNGKLHDLFVTFGRVVSDVENDKHCAGSRA